MKGVDRQLYVRIENKSLVPFFDLDKDQKRSLNLTTLKDGQRTAIVSIYRKDRDGREILLKQYTVSPLPSGKAGEPQIQLTSRKSGPRSVDIELSLGRRRIAADRFRLPGGGRIWWWLLGALIILLLGLLSLFLLRPATASAPDPLPSRSETRTDAVSTVDAPIEERSESEPIAEPESEPAEVVEELPAPEPEPEPAAVLSEPIRRTIYFNPDSSALTDRAREVIEQLAADIRDYPDIRITVRGHCAVKGTEEGRRELSEERAAAAATLLRSNGFRIDNSRGLGAEEPITLEEKDQYLNRRVEIIVEGE